MSSKATMATITAALLIFSCSSLQAASPWSVLKTNKPQGAAGSRFPVDNQAQLAVSLSKQADGILKQGQSESSLKAAMMLYAQSGQIFEKCANDYQALKIQGGATAEDVDNALRGMRYCVNSIKEIKGHYVQTQK